MKIVQINQFSYKAAGNIMMNLHKSMLAQGFDSYVVWGRGREPVGNREYKMTNSLDVAVHGVYSRLFDRTGFASSNATRRLVAWLNNIKPDIIHLHCIHGYYLNIKILFDYIRQNDIRVVWTQHDCWAFTGHCAYFDAVGCEKWKTGCFDCPQLNTYPKALVDNSKKNWLDKKTLFSGLNIQIVTPCEWLKEKMKDSFLGEYPIEVIYNGIDLNVFHPVKSDYKSRINATNKYMILGVAGEWTARKGLNDFVKLGKMLDQDFFQIVLVGLTVKQKKKLPSSIIGIERTENVRELVELYSAADVFLNPTYEDNYPTTNLEAIACGTRVLTYKTGGSPESIGSETGKFFEKGDAEGICRWILNDCCEKKKEFSQKYAARFDKENMVVEYLKLYNK